MMMDSFMLVTLIMLACKCSNFHNGYNYPLLIVQSKNTLK